MSEIPHEPEIASQEQLNLNKLEKIAKYFDNPKKALELITKHYSMGFIRIGDGTIIGLDSFIGNQEKAHKKRMETNTPGLTRLLSIELEGSYKGSGDTITSSKLPDLSYYDNKVDKSSYRATKNPRKK